MHQHAALDCWERSHGLTQSEREAVAKPPDLTQYLCQQPADVLAVAELVEAESQRVERMIREQVGHLLAYASRVSGPSDRSYEQIPQLGKLDLGQPATGQRLGP